MRGNQSTVATVRCDGYQLPRVRKAVRQCLEALPELQEKLRQADRVLLKPNLLSSRAGPEQAVNTHPFVVRALAEILKSDFRCRVAVGDSCGSLTVSSTARAIENSGMGAAARAAGAGIYNVDSQPRHPVGFEEGVIYKEIPLPANLSQFDLILPVAKLKTHNLTYVTCAVKNLLGLVPGAGKKQAHLLAPRPEEFATLLADLFALVRPAAGFVDGIVGMEGNGPNNGRPRHVGLLAASSDCVALDSVCARVMGIEPSSVPLLRECEERALGNALPEAIEVRGEPLSACAPAHFALPPAYLTALALRSVPRWLFRKLFDAFCTVYSSIDQGRCTRCGECMRNCPSGAIHYDGAAEQYRVERERCISCYCCDEVCPHDAVRMRATPLRRALQRLRRAQ